MPLHGLVIPQGDSEVMPEIDQEFFHAFLHDSFVPFSMILCSRVRCVGEVHFRSVLILIVSTRWQPRALSQPPQRWQVSTEVSDHSLCLSSPWQVMGQVCGIKEQEGRQGLVIV